MAQNENFLTDYQQQKQELVTLASKAQSFGWIDEKRYNEICTAIKSDVLTLGVIGQMKCGKSTFLNAFIFGASVLPAASTPMTAALSEITYGENKGLVAEFYTETDWQEQEALAKENPDQTDDELKKAKINAAQELIKASACLGSSLRSYLGKTQNDTLENLEQYVGANGKYVAITKAVKITLPEVYLQGIKIVDTPGMNDPIVSREERTRDFLKNADAVVLLLAAGRPFDAKDRTILFEDIRKCGMGKVLIGINKYDTSYHNGVGAKEGMTTEDYLRRYIKTEIEKECAKLNDNTLNNLLDHVQPVPLSAEMALLSKLPLEKIRNDEILSVHWNNICEDFGTTSQDEILQKSHISDLNEQVLTLIKKEKAEILFAKHLNTIRSEGSNKLAAIEKAIAECNHKLKASSMNEEQINKTLNDLAKTEERVNKKLDRGLEHLREALQNEESKVDDLEKTVSDACTCMKGIVSNWKVRTGSEESIRNQLDSRMITLESDLKRDYTTIVGTIKTKLSHEVDEAFKRIEANFEEKLPDFSPIEFLDAVRVKIGFKIDRKDDFGAILKVFDKKNFGNIKGGYDNSLRRDALREALNDAINGFQKQFKLHIPELFKKLCSQLEADFLEIKKVAKDDIIAPLRDIFEETKKGKVDIEKIKAILKEKEQQKAIIDEQKREIEQMASRLSSATSNADATV